MGALKDGPPGAVGFEEGLDEGAVVAFTHHQFVVGLVALLHLYVIGQVD